jgi:hypothetical protein
MAGLAIGATWAAVGSDKTELPVTATVSITSSLFMRRPRIEVFAVHPRKT